MTAGATPASPNRWWPDETRIKIIRQGNIITFYSTNWNDTDNYQISSEIVVDLSSDPRLSVFMDESAYGYYSHSQGGSTYFDVEFDGGINEKSIMSVSGAQQEWIEDVGWQETTTTIQDTIGYIRKVNNPLNGERFIVKETEIVYLAKTNSYVKLR